MIHYLTSGYELLPSSGRRAAIVSLVMGSKHETTWQRLCAASWEAYAERCGLDIVILRDRIDRGDLDRSPGWQKFLVLNLPFARAYERILWLDSDIIIAEDAPDLLEYAGPQEKVSLCVESGRLSPVAGQTYLETLADTTLPPEGFATDWGRSRQSLYAQEGLPPHDIVFNPGVMLMSARHHADAMTEIYHARGSAKLALTHRLLSADLAHILSPRYNWGVLEPYHLFVKLGLKGDESPEFVARLVHFMVCAELRNGYFIHFYGMMNLLLHYAGGAALGGPLAAAA